MSNPAGTYWLKVEGRPDSERQLVWDPSTFPIVLKRIVGGNEEFLRYDGVWVNQPFMLGTEMLQFDNDVSDIGLGGQRGYMDVASDPEYDYYAAEYDEGTNTFSTWVLFEQLMVGIVGELRTQPMLRR